MGQDRRKNFLKTVVIKPEDKKEENEIDHKTAPYSVNKYKPRPMGTRPPRNPSSRFRGGAR